MKKYYNYIIMGLLFVFAMASCDLEEEPVSYAGEKLYDNEAGAQSVMNGIYAGLASYDVFSADFHHLTGMGSGQMATDRVPSYDDIAALNPNASLNFVNNVWRGMYMVIGRTNDFIYNMEEYRASWTDTTIYTNLVGQAYFIRALMYFDLVRIYGEGDKGVPIVTEPVTVETIHNARATTDEVYAQIESDCKMAEKLLPEINVANSATGTPDKSAAYMLMAQVYMQRAGNKTAGETDYWQKAYDEAIKAYGARTLVSDFRDLWLASGNNSTESVFEIQSNAENTLKMNKLYTPKNGHMGLNFWGRLRANLEVYDLHANTHPGDPRIESTFVTKYVWFKKATLKDTVTKYTYPYPDGDKRSSKAGVYPYIWKYYVKDITALTIAQPEGFKVMRYAELLLMLAEIENELNGPANAYQYVNEVLARARNSADVPATEPADLSGLTQEQFREAIMNEYQFELFGEGGDYFRVRRRGYEWFKEHVIIPHNTHPTYDWTAKFDVEYPDNDRVMYMPIPTSEINANEKVSAADQNTGY